MGAKKIFLQVVVLSRVKIPGNEIIVPKSKKFQVIVNFTEIPVNEMQYFINWKFCKIPGNTCNFTEILVSH